MKVTTLLTRATRSDLGFTIQCVNTVERNRKRPTRRLIMTWIEPFNDKARDPAVTTTTDKFLLQPRFPPPSQNLPFVLRQTVTATRQCEARLIFNAICRRYGIQVVIYPNQLRVFFPEPSPRVLDHARRRWRQAALLQLFQRVPAFRILPQGKMGVHCCWPPPVSTSLRRHIMSA